jgi:hypothetical protein
LNADILFLGVDGFDVHSGLSTPNLLEAKLNRAMMDVARVVVAVCDSKQIRSSEFISQRTSIAGSSDLSRTGALLRVISHGCARPISRLLRFMRAGEPSQDTASCEHTNAIVSPRRAASQRSNTTKIDLLKL